ncbi:hypothetical protein K435DRAFT_824424 [Dendrothele bispora CBS 962.96]|uniref:GH16 domain-containing protein n=1 Tax=Dendrothele bispora (strain CBS 962.96) TaxID=1314807 RepID=A0A4S8KN31_DENBC|nr:hypothetical protein K435DRAFT_824424 [Dendrothele bispora CBS 962.96]
MEGSHAPSHPPFILGLSDRNPSVGGHTPHDCVIRRFPFTWRPVRSLLPFHHKSRQEATLHKYVQNPNGSFFVWLPQDVYSRISSSAFLSSCFRFNFFADVDPTHYVIKSFALDNGLAHIQDGTVFMKGDDTTWLADGEFRNSVPISSISQYNFVHDINCVPWGCVICPAWWTVGRGQWPFTGEIDTLEGVHDNEHNQVTWHTGPQNNCQNNTNCDRTIPPNAGCGVQEWSRASYGEDFNLQGGGIFAMKWDGNGIAVWSFFRAAVPADIVRGSPVTVLEPGGCDPIMNFLNHSIVFGNSYATSGCPGTCADRLKDPSNFEMSFEYILVLHYFG